METTITAKSPSLYALGNNILELAQAVEVDPETGEVTGIEELEAAEGAFEDKAAAVAVAIRGAKAYADALKKYKQDIADRQRAAENKIDRLEQYLADMMMKVGKKKIETVEARITLRESEAVDIIDESLIPMEFKKIKYEVSKTAIKEAIKSAGETVPGAMIVTNRSVTIK